MLNPCVEWCYQRFGKGYSPDCDDKCDYARAIKENKELKQELRPYIEAFDIGKEVEKYRKTLDFMKNVYI